MLDWLKGLLKPSINIKPVTDGVYKPIGNIDTKKFEGLRLHVYTCTAGKKTIGYGHNLMGGSGANLIKLNLNATALLNGKQDLTLHQANALFDLDYEDALDMVKVIFPDLDDYPDAVIAILGDLMFNMGASTFKQFNRTIAAFKAKDWVLAASCLSKSKWYAQVGTRSKIIVKTLANL